MSRKVEPLSPRAAARESVALLALRARLSLLRDDAKRADATESCDKIVEVLFQIRDGVVT